MFLTFCTTPSFLGRMEMKGSFISRTKAFACLLTMCAGFSDALYLYLSRWDLGGRPDGNVVFLSVGLIGQQISDVEVKLATMLAFMLGIFWWRFCVAWLTIQSGASSTLVPFIPHNLGDGIFASIGKNVFIVPFGLSLGIVATSFGEVDGYAYNHSFMTGNLKETRWLMGILSEKRRRNSFGKPFYDPLDRGALSLGPFFRPIWSSFMG